MSLGCQHYSVVATPTSTAATHHSQFLYLLTLHSSPKIFCRKEKKNVKKNFYAAAALEILNSERCIHTIKLASKQEKALHSQSPLKKKTRNFKKSIAELDVIKKISLIQGEYWDPTTFLPEMTLITWLPKSRRE